jgi:hypothetical protein
MEHERGAFKVNRQKSPRPVNASGQMRFFDSIPLPEI